MDCGIGCTGRAPPDYQSGQEIRAAFSPGYQGPTEVYTMPAAGGLPTRRTFDGGTANVAGWTPDGKIPHSTRRFSGLPDAQLAAIDADNLPHATFKGRDAQLEAAILYLKNLIREKPVERPAPPKYPAKSFLCPPEPPAEKRWARAARWAS